VSDGKLNTAARIRAERLISIVTPIAMVVAWEFAARANLVDVRILPPPTKVVASTSDLIVNGHLLSDIGTTVARFVAGMVVGAIPGVFVGLTMGLFGYVRAGLNPVVAALSNAPRIALFPLILILFGLNERSNVLMIALGPFFTMLITSMGAVDECRSHLSRRGS
jgi:ABC-type nitrate/sulfonate/bicarbonate transport system permease component